MVALDSGAFQKGYYRRHHDDAVKLDAFEIGRDIEDAARFVAVCFGSNLKYYLGTPRSDIHVSPLDVTANAYRSIISDRGMTEVDDRRGTIEVQNSSPIPLNSDTIMAIALPRVFLEDMRVIDLVRNQWKLKAKDIIRYDIYHDRPASDVREVMARVKDYLGRNRLLKR